MQKRVLLADDHPLFREALRAAIERMRPGMPVEEAGSLAGEVKRALSRDSTVELLLLDLKLPDSEGFAGLMFLRAEFAQTPIVIVSATEDAGTVSDTIAMGAQGFIPKSASLREMAEALTAILAGEIWVPERLRLTEPSQHVRMLASLTPAQVKVLAGLRRGLLNKQMAHEMGISEATVKAHLAAAFRRLGVNNRTQALAKAFAIDIETQDDSADATE